jgi:hypothetical protein
MGIWTTEYGGAIFEGQTPPEWVNEFRAYSTQAPILFAVSNNNVGDYIMRAEDPLGDSKLMRFIRAEGKDDLTDTDQLFLFKPIEIPGTRFVTLWCRASGTTGNENGYYIRCSQSGGNASLYIAEQTAGTSTNIAFLDPLTTPADFLINTWYWLQFRVIGDSLKGRVWEFGTTPPNWQVETTDSTWTAAGWVGTGSESTVSIEHDWYSLATDGDDPLFFDTTPVAPGNDNTLVAHPSTVQTDATSLLIYTGAANVSVDWTLTGDGTLTVLTDQTDAGGKAWARYTPGTVGGHNVDVEVGVPV